MIAFFLCMIMIKGDAHKSDDGAYSLMVKLRSVAAAIRVRFPLGTPVVRIVRFYDTLEHGLQRKHWLPRSAGAQFCDNCGATTGKNTQLSKPIHASVERNSTSTPMTKDGSIPWEIRGWNWGAFF